MAKDKRAVAYCRFSPRKHADRCESVEAQLELIKAYCDKNGYTVKASYSDKALSGSDEDRPGLWAAIDAVKRGDTLIVAKRDRLARDVMLSCWIEKETKAKGVRIVSIAGEGTESDDPTAVLMRRMIDAFAEYERKVIAARTKISQRAFLRESDVGANGPWAIGGHT